MSECNEMYSIRDLKIINSSYLKYSNSIITFTLHLFFIKVPLSKLREDGSIFPFLSL